MPNLLVAQSGGPTAAINATMLGVIQRAVTSNKINKIYGALFGIKGVLDDNLKEIGSLFANPQNMDLLANTPSSALGSCRYKLKKDPETYAKIIDILRKYDIGYFVYIGGNDSMDTVLQLSNYCKEQKIDDIKIMGAPKTVDNDLCVTDHTPGFGSAAKYIATTVAEIFCDIRVYNMPTVTVVEVMGRNAGWLTVSSCLAGLNGHDEPHFMYIPEIPFDETSFIQDIKQKLKETPNVLVAVSEGVKDKTGAYLCEKDEERSSDAFGHKFLSGAGKYLDRLIVKEVGCKVRTVELSLMQRSAAHLASATDLTESRLLGEAALDHALNGGSGEMSVIKRLSDKPYRIAIETTPIENVANHEKLVPLEWMNEKGNNVNQNMRDYLYPLIQGECQIRYKNGIPEHIRVY